MGLFRRRSEIELSATTRVQCTERGMMKARDYNTSDFRYQVLGIIADKGPITIGEVAEDTDRPIDHIKRAVEGLRGLVMTVDFSEQGAFA